jgi:PRTRC genetic system protein B
MMNGLLGEAMKAYVNIGANHEFRLAQAVLVYRGGGEGAFASLHEVKQGENDIPYLASGEAVTTAFLRTLSQGLGARVKPEVFPDTVLARTPEMLVWWSRPQRRVMFFGGSDQEARKLNGLVFPHPALVFKVADKDLLVRAVATSARPDPNTPMKTAPYWNTDVRVCPGSMRVPDSSDVASIPQWDDAFFQSEFTHPAGAVRLISHP